MPGSNLNALSTVGPPFSTLAGVWFGDVLSMGWYSLAWYRMYDTGTV
jgi:hypothetical protein